MYIAALVTLILACVGVLLALIPCLGALNWVAVPFCAIPVILGIIGMATDRDQETGKSRNVGVYIAAIAAPLLLGVIGMVRCILGGGIA